MRTSLLPRDSASTLTLLTRLLLAAICHYPGLAGTGD